MKLRDFLRLCREQQVSEDTELVIQFEAVPTYVTELDTLNLQKTIQGQVVAVLTYSKGSETHEVE